MDKSQFEVGRIYTRKEIRKVLGGDIMRSFPLHQGRVAYCCISQYTHPDAPNILLIRKMPRLIAAAKQILSQNEALPVFIKQEDEMWAYEGEFIAVRYSDDRAEIAPLAKKAYRDDVAGILYLKPISD